MLIKTGMFLHGPHIQDEDVGSKESRWYPTTSPHGDTTQKNYDQNLKRVKT